MDTTMTAWLTTADGSLRRERLPVPAPAADQVAVRALAWALNNADGATSDDEHVAGYEFSGEIIAVGPGADPALVGTRVMGTAPGAFAEVVLAHRRHVVAVPDGVSDEDAAALPTALLTELGALRAAGFRPGQSVLITAATSSIGLVGVQVAKALGAGTVVATSRSTSRHDLLTGVGADAAVTDVVRGALDATGGAGVDVVLDHVGGDVFASTIDAARRGGAVVSVGRLAGTSSTVDLFALAARGVTLRSVSFGFADPEVIGRLLDAVASDVLPAVSAGRVRPVVDGVHPFGDAPAALERLRSGSARGKVVLRP